MLAGTSAATQGRQGRAIPHPLPGAGIRPRRPGSWPRSEQQQRQDHRQPVGIVSRLDTAQGCSSTQAAAQTAAEAARHGRGRLWQPLPGREAKRIQSNVQAAHGATRAGPVPHPLPGAGIGPRRPGNWPRSERQRREDHRQPVGIVSRLDTVGHGCSIIHARGQAGRAAGPPGVAVAASGSRYRAGRPRESRAMSRQRTRHPGPGQALTRSQERA